MHDPKFPPIKPDLLDALSHQAALYTTTLDEAEGTPPPLPDVTSHVAQLILILMVICLYVPLVAFITV